MIKEYLVRDSSLNKLYNAYLISVDNSDSAMSEVLEFISSNFYQHQNALTHPDTSVCRIDERIGRRVESLTRKSPLTSSSCVGVVSTPTPLTSILIFSYIPEKPTPKRIEAAGFSNCTPIPPEPFV